MTRRRSVQDLVQPLRRLALRSTKSRPFLDQDRGEWVEIHPQSPPPTTQPLDKVSRLPWEVALQIFSSLSFEDLVHVQLTCRHWQRIAQDASLWRRHFYMLQEQHPEILPLPHQDRPWQEQYGRARVHVHWRVGAVQRVHLIHQRRARILSVKLREALLVTLSEDNHVRLYEYKPATGFQLRFKWAFDVHHTVECVDVLSEINIMVVALRGAKCFFYDLHKHSTDPIQVLKGGNHPWFEPDAVSFNHDYFAVTGRKPSAVFVWHWRKGIHIMNKAFDNQSHSVHMSGHHLVLISTDGTVRVFDLLDPRKEPVHFAVSPCNLPCLAYDGARNLVLVSSRSSQLHHYQWDAEPPPPPQSALSHSDDAHPSHPAPHLTSSSTYPSLLNTRRRLSDTWRTWLRRHDSRSTPKIPTDPAPLSRSRRHSSYNNYGYACQMRTNRYIRRRIKAGGDWPPHVSLDQPGFATGRLCRVQSIRTTRLRRTAQDILGIAVHHDRIATVDRHGDIVLYALDGSTAAKVMLHSTHKSDWQEDDMTLRDEDDLSDGYHHLRSRLAMGNMGIVYGTRSGALWWLDFGLCPAL